MQVFISLKKENVTDERLVRVQDVSRVYCEDKAVEERVKEVEIYRFREEKRAVKVMDALDVLGLIKASMGEMDGFVLLGEPAIVIEYNKPKKKRPILEGLVVALVCILTFVGASYGIMAYNNDVGTIELFRKMYDFLGASSLKDSHIIEISYAIGLFVGIVIFYDHFAGRKLSKSPTPIEVEMDKYDSDISDSLIGKELKS